MPAPYTFTALFQETDNQLESVLDMPENFLEEDPVHQVTIIHGLREQFMTMDLEELKLTNSFDSEKVKKEILDVYGELFPMKSKIIVDFDSKVESYFISLQHDENMTKIPKTMQPVFVALLISSLTAAGTFIVAANESMLN